MAPHDEPYFPPLEKCLSGSSKLITWKLVFQTLCDHDRPGDNSWLHEFLSCDSSFRLLTNAIRGFPVPSAASESDLETRTAAINVTPSPHGPYNIQDIKDDALWLSKEINLDEVQALRIVTLEWQNRPECSLKEGFSENERVSLHPLLGTLGSLGPLPPILGKQVNDESSKSFLASKQRRSRLLELYLEERRNLLGTCQKLLSLAVAKDSMHQAAGSGEKSTNYSPGTSKLVEIGERAFQCAIKTKTKTGPDGQVLSCMEAMQSRLDSLEKDRSKFQSATYGENVEVDWVNTNLHELITISDILHLNWRKFYRIAKSSIVLPWFQMMAKYDFFASFPAQSDLQADLVSFLQVSAATTSVALLDPAGAVSYLLESEVRAQFEQRNDESLFYFLDRNNVSEFQRTFASLAGACISVASPAVFAWGIILYTIRELGILAKETRDSQHVQKAIDQGAATHDRPRGRRMSSSSSIGSMHQSIYEDVVDRARDVPPDDPVEYLTQSALARCRVFDVIANMASSPPPSGCDSLEFWRNMALLDLVKVSLNSIGYAPELLTAAFTILDGGEGRDLCNYAPPSPVGKELSRAFLSDEFLMNKIFDAAMSRFPYETLPFLRLCKMLADAGKSPNSDISSIAERLLVIENFTHSVPPHFAGYRTVREDENANLVNLERPIDICASSESMFLANVTEEDDQFNSYLIPAGIVGQVVSDSKPVVIMWYHKYPGLEFLGKWLQLFYNDQGADFMHQGDAPEAIILVIIQLLTSLVKGSSEDGGKTILEESSNGLERNSDIVLVVFEIFEQHILDVRYKKAAEGVLDIAAACIEFMEAVVGILPGRIWPSIARSSFLSLTGGSSILATIMSTEAMAGTSNFIMATTRFYARLVDDAIERSLVLDSPANTRELTRLSTMKGLGAPTHVVAQSVLAFTQAIAEIYDSLFSWQLKPVIHQVLIRTSITQAFRGLLDYGYGIDVNDNLKSKLNTVASIVPPYVLDFFRPDAQNDTNLRTVFQILADGLDGQESLHQESIFQAQVFQTEQTLWLCYSLIRAARSSNNSEYLEPQLYQTFPLLIRLYGLRTRYQLPCIKIMTELTAVGSISEINGSSLLSLLGMESSRSLLEVLSTFDKPRSDIDLLTTIWQMLTAMLTARQQWLAIYLLTGLSPREAMKESKSDGPSAIFGLRGRPFLETALDDLLHIDSIDGQRAIAMLSFVCRAQENWSWATTSGRSHPDFFASMMSYVGKLDLEKQSALSQCYQYKIAALIAELSTVYLHEARSDRNYSIIKKMIPAFRWYAVHAVKNPNYNRSLHANLRKNLQSRYPNCDILQLKKTAYSTHRYGEDFFYDVSMASKLLSFDPSWTGTVRNPGFAHEIRLANLNLSLVDAQLSLLQSFKASCLEHSAFFARDREVQKLMAQIVRNSMAANLQPCPHQKIFESLFETRMELAVGLLQRLVELRARGSEFATLLAEAWETTKFRNGDYNAAIANNDLLYYRSCLSSLLLCTQLHAESRRTSSSSSERSSTPLSTSPGRASHTATRSIVLEILAGVVAEGVGQVSSALLDQTHPHQHPQGNGKAGNEDAATLEVGLGDLSLLLSILHTSLQLPAVSQMTAQVSSVFVSSSMIDSAMRLYSWSHSLTPPDVDPVYSSCALSFLVVLSTLPPVAEELGVEGVLSRLSTSRITLALQAAPGGVSPFEQSQPQQYALHRPHQYTPHARRLYAIWSEGILPLCLNLLHSVGRPMASEIAYFLNQFPNQLARASTAFATSYNNNATTNPTATAADGAICLSLAKEASRLALISHILSTYRIAGASAGVDSFNIPSLTRYDEPEVIKSLREDIDEAVSGHGASSFKNRIVVMSEREVSRPKRASKAQKKRTAVDGAGEGEMQHVLEDSILEELKCALVCLQRE